MGGNLLYILGIVITICGTVIVSVFKIYSHKNCDSNPIDLNNKYVQTIFCNERYKVITDNLEELKKDTKAVLRHFKIQG